MKGSSHIKVKTYLVPPVGGGIASARIERLETETLIKSAFQLAPAMRKRFAGLLARSASESLDEEGPVLEIVP